MTKPYPIKSPDLIQSPTALMELVRDLRQAAPNVRAWFNHSNAAELMEKAAGVIEQIAR